MDKDLRDKMLKEVLEERKVYKEKSKKDEELWQTVNFDYVSLYLSSGIDKIAMEKYMRELKMKERIKKLNKLIDED